MIDNSHPASAILFKASGYLDTILAHSQHAADTSSPANNESEPVFAAIKALRQLASVYYPAKAKDIESALDALTSHFSHPQGTMPAKEDIQALIARLDTLLGTWAI